MSTFSLSDAKGIIDYTFYKMESDEDFDKNLEKFKEELLAFCEQLGYKTEKYVYAGRQHTSHLIEFTIKNENNNDYDIILFDFDVIIKNKISYLYLDDEVRSILKHSKDDMFIYLERNDDKLFSFNLDSKLIEYKQLATNWAKLLKQRRIDKKKAELEQDFYKEDDVSEVVVKEEKIFMKNPCQSTKDLLKIY